MKCPYQREEIFTLSPKTKYWPKDIFISASLGIFKEKNFDFCTFYLFVNKIVKFVLYVELFPHLHIRTSIIRLFHCFEIPLKTTTYLIRT